MEKIDAALYLWLSEWAESLSGIAQRFPNDKTSDPENTLGHLKQLQGQCERLGLGVTSHHLFVMIACIEAERDFSELGPLGNDIHTSLFIELQAQVFLALLPGRRKFYEQWRDGWESVIDRFKGTVLDIEESCKCYALNRNTACVMHAMRILEIGLIAFGKELSVPTDRVNWQNLIEQIEKAIKNVGVSLGKSTAQFYAEAALQFHYLKDAWRNEIMHIHQPFDEERASTILEHTKEFMRHLATRLSEEAPHD